MTVKSKKIYAAAKTERTVPAAPASVVWWRKLLQEPLALGLMPVILIRPWLDGITYPKDNSYFVWAIVILFACWGVRALLRNEPLAFPVPSLLLTLFWLLAGLTLFTTIQYNATYRSFQFWSSYLFLFLLVLNGIKSRTGQAIILGTFGATFFMECLWGILHYYYALPQVRMSVLEDPRIVQQYFFGKSLDDPEIVHRLQVNRAFGSLLFPNALAGFLIMGIPLFSVYLAQTLRGKGSGRDDVCTDATPTQRASAIGFLLLGGLVLLFSFGILHSLVWLIGSMAYPLPPDAELWGPMVNVGHGWQFHSAGYVFSFFLFSVTLPIVFCVGSTVIAARRGIPAVGSAAKTIGLPILFVMQFVLLWLTYSRGGMLALAGAVCITAGLLFHHRLRLGKVKAGAIAAALLLTVTFAGHTLAQQQPSAAQPAPQPTATATQTPAEAIRQIPGAQQAPQAPAQVPGITREGQNLTMSDLANPASFWLRLTYWRTGFRMAMDNFFLGVGLGNYGTAYPKYQFKGAGDSSAAHNDYLQALCETGILGFILFCSFWLYFVVWGARRILRESDRGERLMLIGLYTGVLATLIHSLVDFDFFNPSLAFFAFFLTALFYARSAMTEKPPVASKKWRLALVPMLAAASLVGAMTFCVYLSDFLLGDRCFINVGNNRLLSTIYDAGEFFCKEPKSGGPQKPAAVNIMLAATLIPDQTVLESLGAIRVPAPETQARHRALRPGERVTPNCFLIVTDRAAAREKALPYIQNWLDNFETFDGIFPYSPETAAYFYQYYEMLALNTSDANLKRKFMLKMIDWGEKGVKRNPEQSPFHTFYANALWLRGNIESTPSRRDFFEKALEEYEIAMNLYPMEVANVLKYGDALSKYGTALLTAGDKRGQAFVDKSKSIMERAKQLQQPA